MAYESFYLPAMRYSLAVTSINQVDLETIQCKAIITILAAMGYNRHMPREVVYCTTKFQGLGMKHLYDIQGSDSIQLLIQEINHSSMTGNMIYCTIDAMQMEAGIGQQTITLYRMGIDTKHTGLPFTCQCPGQECIEEASRVSEK
jgi:hypothetical protein